MVVGALALGLAVALTLVPADEASAQDLGGGDQTRADVSRVGRAGEIRTSSAVGAAFFGAACINGICWPGATLIHTIRGTGRSITYQEGFFTDLVGAGTAGRQFCNWRIDFVDYNSSGGVNRRSRGAIHSGCTILENGRKSTVDRTAARSTVKSCAELYSADVRIVRQCHYIF
ncbi:hypothetical protein [Promicromonospora soli]